MHPAGDERAAVDRLDDVIDRVRRRTAGSDAELTDVMDVYAREAGFGRSLIDAEVALLPPGAHILEVGAGTLLLAVALAAEGFVVSAIEPSDGGFGHMERLAGHTLAVAHELGLAVEVIDTAAEDYVHAGPPVDFAFAINVLEHVRDPALAVRQITTALAPGATFHVVCPNYRFPYEPHFNGITLGTRRLTERFLSRRWIERATFPDPVGTWRSLNWITTTTLHRAVRDLPDVDVEFRRDALMGYFDRFETQDSFRDRKGAVFTVLAGTAARVGGASATRAVPTSILPIIDARLTKRRAPLSDGTPAPARSPDRRRHG